MKKRGYIEVILSGICFGFLGYFGKKAFLFNMTPGELLALRYLISAFLLFCYLLITDRDFLTISLKDKLISGALGIFGYALFSSLFFYTLTGLSASMTVLLLYTYPIMVALLSFFILKEKFNIYKIFALILVSIGMYFLVGLELKSSGKIYFLTGLSSAFFYSLYIIYSRKYLERVKPLTSSLYVQIGAGLVLSLIHFHQLERPLTLLQNHFFFLISMAFICSFLAMSLFLSGLQKITSTETSILSTTEPISGIIIASLFLGEKLNGIQIIGAILILSGMILVGFSLNDKKAIDQDAH
jgi:drug/metabolite transporter (DMT)-like permease